MSRLKLPWLAHAKLPMILQQEQTECGHACIAMIANFWGHELDLFAMRRLKSASNRGINLLELKHLFDSLGFISRALKVSLDDLNKIKMPAILHWDFNHFVVLKKVTRRGLVIHDPAVGIRCYSIEQVSRSFTGIVVEVDKAQHFQAINNTSSLSYYSLVKNFSGFNQYIGFLLLISLSIEFFNLLNPLLLQYATDSVIMASHINNITLLAIGFGVLSLIQLFTEYIRGRMVIYLTTHITEQLAANVVRHLLKLPMDFFEKRHKGDIQSKFQSIEQIQKKISVDFINAVLDGAVIFINLLVMLIYSRILTGMVLVTMLSYWFIRYASYHLLKKQTEVSVQQHAKAASLFLETLQSMLSIKSYLKEQQRFTLWRNVYIQGLNAEINMSKIELVYKLMSQLFFSVEHVLVICVGAYLVLNNQFSLGMLMAFLSYRLLLLNKTSTFIQNVMDYRLIAVQLTRLSDIILQEAEVSEGGLAKSRQTQASLRLKNLSFRYHPSDDFVFKNINLHVDVGEKVVIVGPSGCGKSTLLKVMMGLLNKTEGEIFIDDLPMLDYGLTNYRAISAGVMQADSLLSGSILANISFFDEDVELEQVYEVAKLANIHEDIMRLPMRYETLVGDMGSMLSGG